MLLFFPSAALNSAIAAQDRPASSPAAGINSSGFVPEIDGFGFQNYGGEPTTVDLTPVEMQRMFGEQVCAYKKGSNCTLTYPAQRWMDQAISAMRSGHCEGLAVLSDLIYFKRIDPQKFGSDSTIDLLLQNETLQREIGYWWVTQVTRPGGSLRIHDSPDAIVDVLSKAFDEGQEAEEWWVMGLYLEDGGSGHAVTPIAVQEMGNGTARILVYDNNWPKETRFIEINRTANTWRYQASINPNEASTIYSGNSSTKNLEIVSVRSRQGIQQCDFCDGMDDQSQPGRGAEISQKRVQIWQRGRANVLVSDENGRRVGFLDTGKPINEIPDAEIRMLRFDASSASSKGLPVIFVPGQQDSAASIKVNISSSENGSGKNSAETVIIAPGFAASTQIPDLVKGQQQRIELRQAGRDYSINLSGNLAETPTLTVETNQRQVTIEGMNIDPNGNINISVIQSQETFNISTLGNANPGKMQLRISSIDPENGELSTFQSLDLILRPGDAVSLNEGSPGRTGEPELYIAHQNGVSQSMGLRNTSSVASRNQAVAYSQTSTRLPDTASGSYTYNTSAMDVSSARSTDVSSMSTAPGVPFTF